MERGRPVVFYAIRISLITLVIIFSFEYVNAQTWAPPAEWKSVTHMRDPLGNLPASTNLSGEDWWYNFTKMYDASDNHIGYIAVGFSNFSNFTYSEPDPPFQFGYVSGCADFQVNDPFFLNNVPNASHQPQETGSTFQSIGIFNLSGRMIRCRTINSGTFWGVAQSSDREHIIAVGTTFATKDFRSSEWSSEPNGMLVYNPTTSNNPGNNPFTFFDYSNYPSLDPTKLPKLGVVKMDNELDVEWNYIYSGFDYDVANNGANALEFGIGTAFDVVALPSGSSESYRVIGKSSRSMTIKDQNAYVLDLDENGYINWDDFAGPISADAQLYNIIKSPTSNTTYVCGYRETTATNDGNATMLLLACYAPFASSSSWIKTYDNSTFSEIDDEMFNGAMDMAIDNNGNLLVGAIINCFKSDENGDNTTLATNPHNGHTSKGTGSIFTFSMGTSSSNGGISVKNPVLIGLVKTYDLKIGVTSISGGGFATVSTKTPENNNGSHWYFDDFTSQYPYIYLPGSYNSLCSDDLYEVHNYDADSYVAKYEEHPTTGEWEFKWHTTIDTDKPRSNFPGQIKKQECVYKIEEADDGGLVFVGNTSHNHDDNYMVKIAEPCVIDYVNNNPEESIKSPEEVISANEHWNKPAPHIERYILDSPTNYEQWSGKNLSILGTIVIPEGQKLSIVNSTLKFIDSRKSGIETKIVVERGGELEIENSTLTVDDNCPNAMWDGIIVEGHPNRWKYFPPASTDLAQGRILVEGCTISHARMAIYAGDEFFHGPVYQYGGGGIVRVHGSRFEDNRFDIKFMPYNASWDGPGNGGSRIVDSEFISTGQLNDENAVATRDGVHYPVGTSNSISIWGVNNIRIRRNTFEGASSIDRRVRPIGIISHDAAYDVKDNTFNRHSRSLQASASEPLRTILIEDNDFDNFDHSAVFLKNIDFVEVFENNFNFNHGTPQAIVEGQLSGLVFPAGKTIGLHLRNSFEYKVARNTFENTSSLYRGTGVIVYNDNAIKDEEHSELIYKNTFEGLVFSSYGNGQLDGDESPLGGLDFKCNTYTGNAYDILNTVSPGASVHQGGPSLASSPAGNLFDGCDLNEAELRNQVNNYIYWHHIPTGTPSAEVKPASGCVDEGMAASQVKLEEADVEYDDPENEACPQIFHTSNRLVNSRDDYYQSRNDYAVALASFNSTIDDGDQQVLLDAIDNDDTPNDIETLFDPISPYLSDDVLIALINDKPTPMPSADLVAILVDNSPLTQAVVDAVDTRTPAISGTDQTSLDNAQTGMSGRRLLELELSEYTFERDQFRNEYLRAIIHIDSSVDRLDSLRAVLSHQNLMSDRMVKAASYMMEGNYTGAESEIAVIGSVSDWEDMAELMEIQLEWHKDSVNLDSVARDTNLRNQIDDWAGDTNSVAQFTAKTIKEIVDHQVMDLPDMVEPYFIPEIDVRPSDAANKRGQESIAFEDDNDAMVSELITAYPNPFDGTISFRLAEDNGHLIITTVSGTIVDRIRVNSETMVFDGNKLTSGLYFASFISATGQSQTISIVKL